MNAKYHELVSPEHSSITPAYLLTSLIDARTDMFLAAEYMSELVTAPSSTAAIRVKFEDILRRRNKSEAEIKAFQELVLNNGAALREVINSGERSIDELFELLAKARKFKEVLSKINPDEGHLTHYYQQLLENSWLDRLPVKILRFAMFSAIGAGIGAIAGGPVGATLGLGVGAADTFLVDKLLSGWRPNQFVKGHLAKFVDPDRRSP